MKSLFLNVFNMRKFFTFWVIILLVLINGWYGKNLKRWDKNDIIKNDVTHYYAYFPATFIYHDWNFGFTKELPQYFEGRIWLLQTSDEKPVLKMTMGLSMLWLPFETVAHLYAKYSHFRADGYTKPYSVAIFIAALFYLFLGLIFLRKILLKYFCEITTILTILLIVLGTNLMYYVISEPGMSHVYNFFLITIFIYLCIKWYEKPILKYTLLLGFVVGLIVLIRPTNIVVLLIFLLWGVVSLETFWMRIRFLLEKRWMILIAVFAAFIVILPQLLYWKTATGHWVYYSYGSEGFYFQHSHIVNGLFSYRKGWLVYTPVMVFALIGFIFLHKYIKGATMALSGTMCVTIYIVYSWWCWWYGGSYGSRPMIDFYGIMALPLAAIIQKAIKHKAWLKTISILFFAFFVYLNQIQMSQYRTSLLHWDSMTKEAYWGILFKKGWTEGYDKMIKTPDYEKAMKGEEEY